MPAGRWLRFGCHSNGKDRVHEVVVAPAPTLGDVFVGTVVGGAINNAVTGGRNFCDLSNFHPSSIQS